MQHTCVLRPADTTEVNRSRPETAEGLGPIGRGNTARGFFVQTMIASNAASPPLPECRYPVPGVREAAPKGETKALRIKPVHALQNWERSIPPIGQVPDPQTWISMGNRDSDSPPVGRPVSRWERRLWCVWLRIVACFGTKNRSQRTMKCHISQF